MTYSAFGLLSGLLALGFVAGSEMQPLGEPQAGAGAFAPRETRTFQQFGAIGDGRADDSAAVSRAFAHSDKYCLDGRGRTYRVNGTLRVGKDLCLRNVTLVQAAIPADTAAFINRTCPPEQDPEAVIDCKDPAVPGGQLASLWESLSIRTLLIRPDGNRPLRVNLDRVKVDRGPHAEQGSRSDSAGIWLDGADRVDFRDVEITGNGKGYGLHLTNARNVTLTNLWVHDLVWAPYRGDKPLSQARVASVGWNKVPIHEFRERRAGRTAPAKFYGVRIQEQLTCVALSNVNRVTIENVRIERCHARFDTGDLPWQTDGLSIGRSSSDVTIKGARVDSTWEAVDIVAGGSGIDRLRISDLTLSNAFSFGLKMGYQLRDARVSGLVVDRAGLAGIVIYGPVRDVRITRASITNVGAVRSSRGSYSPWPGGNRAGIRIDGQTGSEPQNVVLEDTSVSGRPTEMDFGILNTTGRGVQLVRFQAEGFGSARAAGPEVRQ